MITNPNFTIMLNELSCGNEEIVGNHISLLYNNLRSLTQKQLNRERKDHTPNASALINEAYLKLVDHFQVNWQCRSHFLGISALVIKSIFINYAKQRVAQKRGGGLFAVTFNEKLFPGNANAEEILEIEKALEKLLEQKERYAIVVEFKLFLAHQWKKSQKYCGYLYRQLKGIGVLKGLACKSTFRKYKEINKIG